MAQDGSYQQGTEYVPDATDTDHQTPGGNKTPHDNDISSANVEFSKNLTIKEIIERFKCISEDNPGFKLVYDGDSK